MKNQNFKEKVYNIVCKIPVGKVLADSEVAKNFGKGGIGKERELLERESVAFKDCF